MEYGVHISLLMKGVEHRSRDVADTLGNKPDDSRCADRVEQRLKGHQYRQSHADEAERLKVGVLLQSYKTDYRTSYGTQPDKDKKPPAPVNGKG